MGRLVISLATVGKWLFVDLLVGASGYILAIFQGRNHFKNSIAIHPREHELFCAEESALIK